MDELHVGRGTTRGAMTVFPLWGATGGRRRYTMGGRDLEVAEMPEGPYVGSLLVGNRAVVPALVLEGQLFEGGWQHRMSRHSLMVGAGERMAVEVACVEEGRWGGAAEQRTRGRRATPYVADAVRHGADTEGDDVQGEVWSRVAAHTRGVHATATGSLVERLDTFRHEATDWSRVRPLIGQVGVLVGIGGQPYVAEVFDSPTALRDQLPALLEAAALDAQLARAVPTPGRRARRFVDRAARVRLAAGEQAGVAERRRAATDHLDVVALRWDGHDVHTRITHVRHPLLAGAGR
ncbi:ARPP-1 family domain-containing protein [Nocardioides sp. P86]|uniref:ARPP-1 family domain-containing protein n=1 Tax=Nocardioides sp. P86 TaxID=2939569 RepID=UPI00203DCF9B|nr:DUF6569 family protein [Nocardioides sp. P86]MCM3516588.1 hypothetical protein [Nocardioides sp. P86]